MCSANVINARDIIYASDVIYALPQAQHHSGVLRTLAPAPE
jgi:hypothetical protein